MVNMFKKSNVHYSIQGSEKNSLMTVLDIFIHSTFLYL